MNSDTEKGNTMTPSHGGNVYEMASRLGCAPEAILDFSASINPLGLPPGLQEEMNRSFGRLQHYPDIRNLDLVRAIAAHHGVSPEQIVVGNGSTELIYWLPQALGISKAVMALPTFSEYRKAFELQNVRLTGILTRPENFFQPSVEQLEAACAEASPEAILATNPGSPSGALLPPSVRDYLIAKSRKDGVICIVDEVFIDFCEEESLKRLLEACPFLVLIRSMTKFYGIPGLRLGYLLTSTALANRLRDRIPPWSVNTLAQIAGTYCFTQDSYRRETIRFIEAEREKMRKILEELPGCRPLPGRANYLLFELDEGLPPASVLREDLAASDRILVRDCSSFEGMGDRCVRVAVRLPEENRKLLDALSEWTSSRLAFSRQKVLSPRPSR